MTGLLVCIFILILVPTFYTHFFKPCMDCYDFEASIAHEVGHVLGFSHPDRQQIRNIHLDASVLHDSTSCLRPLDHVAITTPPEKPTIMYSRTKHRVRTCLSEDDYIGLHALYPTCEHDDAAIQPECVKPRQVIGYLRLIIHVALPYVLTTILLIAFQQLVKWHYRQRLAALQRDVKKLQSAHRLSVAHERELEGNVAALENTRQELEDDLLFERRSAEVAMRESAQAHERITELERSRRQAAEIAQNACAALEAERQSHSATKQRMRNSSPDEMRSLLGGTSGAAGPSQQQQQQPASAAPGGAQAAAARGGVREPIGRSRPSAFNLLARAGGSGRLNTGRGAAQATARTARQTLLQRLRGEREERSRPDDGGVDATDLRMMQRSSFSLKRATSRPNVGAGSSSASPAPAAAIDEIREQLAVAERTSAVTFV